jgi:hypothetical protein
LIYGMSEEEPPKKQQAWAAGHIDQARLTSDLGSSPLLKSGIKQGWSKNEIEKHENRILVGNSEGAQQRKGRDIST